MKFLVVIKTKKSKALVELKLSTQAKYLVQQLINGQSISIINA
ncbi:21704_t:CDS:2 [Gigaspora rosea]|nr:21704_t:CDS:2 [Gigaspora rosea]